jgi:hypothetical protein
MYPMLQLYTAATLNAMDKMWLSFIGIGLMIVAAFIITYARKTKGIIRVVLTLIAIVILIYGIITGLISII